MFSLVKLYLKKNQVSKRQQSAMGDNRESGFINSEPCIAEFMTNVPLINQGLASSSINLQTDAGYCQSFNGALPNSPSRGDLALSGTPEGAEHNLGGKFNDYAWMKEKKPMRKSDPPQTVPDIGKNLHNQEFHFKITVLNDVCL